MRYKILIVLIVISVSGFAFLIVSQKYLPGEKLYDWQYKNPPVLSFNDAKMILHKYRKISSDQLPLQLRKKLITNDKFAENKFFVIPKNEAYKKLFLHNRINDILSRDQQVRGLFLSEKDSVYLCINEQLLRSVFTMSDKLNEKNYNPNAIHINSGFRSPSHNDEVKGARNSQHLYGKALDLYIGDINRDGKVNANDKDIVYQNLDKEIIRNSGGLGYYPGTQIIHVDVRGKRARWDKYKRS